MSRWPAVIAGLALVASGCAASSGGLGQVAPSGELPQSATTSQSVSIPSESVPPPVGSSPWPAASASALAVPPPAESAPTTTPTPRPTPAPTSPKPSVALGLNGLAGTQVQVSPGGTADVHLSLRTTGLDQKRCSLIHQITPDSPLIAPSETSLPPVDDQTVAVVDGLHGFHASCPSGQGTLTAETGMMAADGAPERCAGWAFPEDPVSISTIDELTSGIVGSWHGCVDTPWVPTYWITMEFRGDGTYSATAVEVVDGFSGPALYYGTDDDDPAKRWRIDDLQASQLGIGIIDIVFDAGSVNRDPISAIRLMGDRLEFEMMHHGQYGPLVFQLVRD